MSDKPATEDRDAALRFCAAALRDPETTVVVLTAGPCGIASMATEGPQDDALRKMLVTFWNTYRRDDEPTLRYVERPSVVLPTDATR